MTRRQLRNALRWGDPEIEEFTEDFLATKLDVYADTLEDLAVGYGYDAHVQLSDDVVDALRAEARRHAESVVTTFNKEVDKFVERNHQRPLDELLSDYEAWSAEHGEMKAEQIAVTEAYSPHADATLSFFTDNGLEPEFDFGGHSGDDAPACPTCKKLADTGPHPLAKVLEVGVPHIQCRQKWHPRVDPADLPDELELGRAPAGIIGGDPLVNREGSQESAVESLRSE